MSEKTVLVVEDDRLNMKLVVEVLRLGDYNTLEAPDAETGISLARKHKPDLILMDLHLPGMDGLTATRLICADDALKNIPVLALTALAMPEDREKALDAGCIDCVTKPFDVTGLLNTIDHLVKAE